MGVWGWDEIKDNRMLKGFVNNKPGYYSGDGDWSFMVRPANGFRSLLTNPSHLTNSNGLIECEFEPTDDLNGVDAKTDAAVNNHLADFKDNWITVLGSWVRDRSHSSTGHNIGLGDQQDFGKTEIHPIKWIILERRPAPNNRSRVIEFLVFSDDSKRLPSVPHADENVVAKFSIPIPLGSKMNSDVRIKTKVDKSKSSQFTISDSGRFSTLQGTVASGKASDEKGFFHATIELPGFTLLTFMLSREVKAGIGVRELLSRAEVKSVRALFKRLDAATLWSRGCVKLFENIQVVQSQISNILDQQEEIKQGGPENPFKPGQDPVFQELQKEKADLEKELKDLRDKGDKAGCVFD